MKKYLTLAALTLSAFLILGVSTGRVFARLTGTNPGTDIWCAGPSGAELCLDVSGNLLPTTSATQTLGSSSLPWASVTATAVVPTDTVSSRLHAPWTTSISSTALISMNTTAGDIFLVRRLGGALWAVCTSTGGVNSVVFSSAPAVPCRESI
jgi:hypothetical protein